MRDNMYENNWSPFDPKWYKAAFDQFISTADQLFNTDLIIEQGFNLPDTDGSKSSVFRNEAVLNNSFNENKLRETLKDIYLNSSHKLIASNHDNVHFYQWHGYMSNMKLIHNTNMCEFSIPTETFISSKGRDKFKLSQFYGRWIKVEDILNNWEVFKWHCMVFINQRIYSEYELKIDDKETVIRFKYYDHWIKNDYSIDIYKFDTNASCRVKISNELCNNVWNWKMPIDYIDDQRVVNSSNIMVTFNKISNSDIREDGLTQIEVLGDNIEFLKIEDGFIDLSHISKFNNVYIQSESNEWLYMSIIVPKFFHEYPIMLPTDIIYRPYEADLRPIIINDNMGVRKIKVNNDNENKQVYIDVNGKIQDDFNNWEYMIRPIVLSDAFDDPFNEPYNSYVEELKNLRDLTVKGSDTIEDFRFFLQDNPTEEKLIIFIDQLSNEISDIHNAYNSFLKKRYIDINKSYEFQYKKFCNIMNEIREDGLDNEWLNRDKKDEGTERDFFLFISPQIYIPRELYDKYEVVNIINSLENHGIQWENISEEMGQHRFRHPIDENDFWTFEYDPEDRVWRPYHLNIIRHFPDVYLPSDPMDHNNLIGNKIFKTFFFYSDTMNVNNISDDIIRATPSWDNDMQEYEYDQGSIYRDIFMEKFYWMGVRAIYKGLVISSSRWEILEYIINNNSYARFNQLFLKTMDPYFKMGLATYLKSSNFEFPFDEAVNKMQEAITQDFIGYKRITNFEMYLNKSWVPSYFDYITKILDNWQPGSRLLRRPRSSFDILRLLPLLIQVENNINIAVGTVNNTLSWIVTQLRKEMYHLNINNIFGIQNKISEMLQNIKEVYRFTNELDLDIYGIEDLNHIADKLKYHIQLTDELEQLFNDTKNDIDKHNVYQYKIDILSDISKNHLDLLYNNIIKVGSIIQDFNMEEFMLSINDLYTYFIPSKENPDDRSLIGYINKFNNPWSIQVKDLRNSLFQSSSKLYSIFNSTKAYTKEEIIEFANSVEEVNNGIDNLYESIQYFWLRMGYNIDQTIIDKLNHVKEILNKLNIYFEKYIDARGELILEINEIKSSLELIDQYNISNVENEYYKNMINCLENVIIFLSYIAGSNKKNEALNEFNKFKNFIILWNGYLSIEEEVFTKLTNLTTPPIEFIERLRQNEELLNSMIEYMNTANIEYIPDSSLPTYSDVYSIENIDIISGGFYNKLDEFVAIQNIGSYKISDISNDEVSEVLSLSSTNYRTTTFRDPMIQLNPYDAISSGNGMGITIKPLSSKKISIINDEVIRMFITRIQNSSYLVSINMNNPNPYNDDAFYNTLNGIKIIESDWLDTMNFYRDHISNNTYKFMTDLIKLITSLIEPSEALLEVRKDIDIAGLITNIDTLISKSYNFAEENNLITDEYLNYEENIKRVLVLLQDFYGNGTSWNDSSIIKNLLDEVKYPLRVFEVRIINQFPDGEIKEELSSLISNTLDKIPLIENSINKIPNLVVDIAPIIRTIDKKIHDMSDDIIQKDEWYRIRNIRVAMEGHDYKVGDVLSIIPELPKDSQGNPITDMEDIIMNDVILIKIKEVIDGKVTTIEPLLDYAIPYLIWGVRETKTLIGNGNGISVDINSYQIELSDSTLFYNDDYNPPMIPQYNENDMFVFKFENIHDLNIQYEVFYGGKQITNFFQRHINGLDKHHPSSIDALYLNANEVNGLKNSSIYIPAENYFVYKLDNVEIKDPGAGYAVGQEIFVDLDTISLRLKIASLAFGPTKGIEEIEMSDVRMTSKVDNPSSSNALVSSDSLNNIDDEFNVGYYDKLPQEGIIKGATRSLDPDEYPFISRRFDSLKNSDRNKNYMYPDVDIPLVEDVALNGDPDEHFYLGNRIDENHKWNGIMNTISPTDPFIFDDNRVPTNKPLKGEYQLIAQQRFHNSINETNKNVTEKFNNSIINANMIIGDYVVDIFDKLPRSVRDWPDAKIGKCVIVENDETNDGHRMLYRLRTFVAAGYFVYDLPEIADYKWDHINIDWMNIDSYPDHPTDKARFATDKWFTTKTQLALQRSIVDGEYEDQVPIIKYYNMSYIHDLTVDDLSVWNCNKHEWEDLHDKSKWLLEVTNDDKNQQWGFKLSYLEDGIYSYDMMIFLNKIPETQMKNAELKSNAVMNITASISKEVNNHAINSSVNTGRHLRIRKLFPYEQKETFTIGRNKDGSYRGYEMDFIVSPYMHFRNELHLEDVKIYNKTAGRFENILDPNLFEVRFKDNKAYNNGYETNTKIIQSFIGYPGSGFVDGEVWAYNDEFGVSVFGIVTTNYRSEGNILTFIPIHCVNPPQEDTSLEFQVYQRDSQSRKQMAIVTIEFQIERISVNGDGYIHNVINPFAPLPKEFKIICQYNLDTLSEYNVIISKTAKQWKFIEPKWMVSPTFNLPDHSIQKDRIYILTSNGRFPLVNPSTGKPSIDVVNTDNGTDVTFLNLYKKFEHLEVRTTPYPMRSVYVQRRIPKSGYIDLAGKINKPINKKYFEFWVNGRLLFDEVTIITPTKLFLHGLKSLKNLEIIEVNRDPNEYFSDSFLEVNQSDLGRPFYNWNYETYLDAALEGNLEDDNYTPEEQEYLLSPVWKQVEKDHPEFKNYPPNTDIESDILTRVSDEDYPLDDLEEPNYQFMILNVPTLEDIPLVERNMSFEHFGFIPMTDNMITDILNEEWKDEINSDPYFPEHSVMTDAEWYGMTARLYDEYGIRVHTLDESVYHIFDNNVLRINTNSKLSRIVKNKVIYDLN